MVQTLGMFVASGCAALVACAFAGCQPSAAKPQAAVVKQISSLIAPANNPRRFGNLFSPGKVPALHGMLFTLPKKVFEILIGTATQILGP